MTRLRTQARNPSGRRLKLWREVKDLVIGDKKEIDKATWRKPRGHPVNTYLSLYPRQAVPQARLNTSAFGTSPCEGATDHRWKTSLTMIVIQAPCERHREHNDRGDDQTADEQNTLSSTIHPIAIIVRLVFQR